MGKAARQRRTPKNPPIKTEVALPPPPGQQAALVESNALWGSFSFASSLVLIVVAAMVKDFRWLLWGAWLVSWITVGVVTKRISPPKCEPAYFVLGVMITALSLYWVNVMLEPKASVALGPQLSIEGDKEFYVVPQENQPLTPKVSRYARIKVTNTGEKSVANVKAAVIRVNSHDWLFQLPLSSRDTLFIVPNPSLTVAVTLNPGEDQHFDVLVECNGPPSCPKGQIAVPYVAGGHRELGAFFEGGSSRPNEVTVRASGDGVGAVTKTFAILQEPSGKLLLKPKPDVEEKK